MNLTVDWWSKFLVPVFFILVVFRQLTVNCLQCYSCKATGSNELDANIKCLENAYLENCEEFYDYYNEIEDQDVISYEYYYYDKPQEGATSTSTQGNTKRIADNTGGGGGSPATGGATGRGAAGNALSSKEGRRNKRAAKKKKEDEKVDKDENKVDKDELDEDEYVEYYYDYEYLDDNVTYTDSPTAFDDVAKSKTKDKESKTDKDKDKSNKKPSEPQHHCYSQALKSNWESYTVEKGCKKISYCKNSMEKKPEWAHPWNFCCDKSRCNVKLVKDKPQRVFGMGCRRQDDCIQGHLSRTLCPHYFKTCPRISTSMVKMECRVKARTMGTVKNGPKYRHQFREKKCYCAKGYFPRGPICTSGAESVTKSFFLANLTLGLLLFIIH